MKLTAWCILSHCRDVEAEAVACLEGVHMAIRWPEISMILESDCQTVVANFHTKGHDRSALWQVFAKLHDAGSQLCQLEVIKISRDQSNMAHELARFAFRSRKSLCFFCLFSRVGCVPLL